MIGCTDIYIEREREFNNVSHCALPWITYNDRTMLWNFAMLLMRNNIYHVQPMYICIMYILPLFYLFILCCISLSHTYITHSFTFEVHVLFAPRASRRSRPRTARPAASMSHRHSWTPRRRMKTRSVGGYDDPSPGHGSWEITELVGVIPNGKFGWRKLGSKESENGRR